MAERIRFDFDGPRSWVWSFKDPKSSHDDYSIRRSYTFSVTHIGNERWIWSVIGLCGDGFEFEDMNGRAHSMQACVQAAIDLFKRAGIEIDIPLPVLN
jgi:hypothetical protein